MPPLSSALEIFSAATGRFISGMFFS
ncbi:hypothetical protein LINPERPRIM_LOCUS22722 [Linum perenne]